MIEITKDNLLEFINYYHYFHDSYITNINYDINNSQIELYIDVCWSGKATIKENGYYNTNKTKMKILFNGVTQCNNKEIFSWDYIDEALIKYIKIESKEYICFASAEENPFVYIVCDSMKYEELNDKKDKN